MARIQEYSANSSGGLDAATPFDPDSTKEFALIYRPDLWQASTVYLENEAVMPTVFCGLYLVATAPGCSGSSEPTVPTVVDSTVSDGTTGLFWKAVEYDWFLSVGEDIASSVWVVTNAVTLGSLAPNAPSNTINKTTVWVIDVPTGVTEFTLTNTIVTSAGNRTDDRSIIVAVEEK